MELHVLWCNLICVIFLVAFGCAKGCPTGWVSRNHFCYYVNSAPKTWQNARTDCQRMGGDLVVIKDAEENQFVASLSSGHLWIGLSDLATEGKWTWVDGTDLTSDKSHWTTGEPNNINNEDCAHRRDGTASWNDDNCSKQYASICKKEKEGRIINCTSNYMEIRLSRHIYNASKYESISLLDPTCRANMSSTYITLGTTPTSCGTSKAENQSHIFYTNHVVLTTKKAAGMITRDQDEAIVFSCAYAKDGYAGGASFLPVSKVVANESGIGSFSFELNMFKSNGYIDTYSLYPVKLKLKDDAYFQVKANMEDNDFVLLINQCYSTPSMDKNDNKKYMFINNRCATDSTVKFYRADRRRQRFSIQAFRFVNNHTSIYIHCFVFLCKKTSTDPRCTSGCSGNNVNRARREASSGITTRKEQSFTDYYMLQAGPIALANNGKSTDKQGKADLQRNLKTTVIVLATGLSVLAVIFALAIVKMRRMGNANINNEREEIGMENAAYGKVFFDDEVEGETKLI